MKRAYIGLFILILLCAMLTACNDTPDEVVTDEVPPVILQESEAVWDADLEQHWQIDETGNKTELAPHQFDGAGSCEICNSTVLDYNDGTYELTVYNKYGNIEHSRFYGEDGNVAYYADNEYEYSPDGKCLSYTRFENGVKTHTAYFAYTNEGFQYAERTLTYQDDQSVTEVVYNSEMDITRETVYLPDGTVSHETLYYIQYDNGKKVEQVKTVNGTVAEKVEYANGLIKSKTVYGEDGVVKVEEFNEYSMKTRSAEYEGDTLVTETVYEYTVDENGNATSRKRYVDGRLEEEAEIAYAPAGYFYDKRLILYNEDGSRTEYEADESMNVTSETVYDADGNIITQN